MNRLYSFILYFIINLIFLISFIFELSLRYKNSWDNIVLANYNLEKVVRQISK